MPRSLPRPPLQPEASPRALQVRPTRRWVDKTSKTNRARTQMQKRARNIKKHPKTPGKTMKKTAGKKISRTAGFVMLLGYFSYILFSVF